MNNRAIVNLFEWFNKHIPSESERNIKAFIITTTILLLTIDIISLIFLPIALFFLVLGIVALLQLLTIPTSLTNLEQLNIQKNSYRRSKYNNNKVFYQLPTNIWYAHIFKSQAQKNKIIADLVNHGLKYEVGGTNDNHKRVLHRNKKLTKIK